MRSKRKWMLPLWWFAAFVLWTATVCFIDVKPIGPMGSTVGLATLNGTFHELTGVHLTLYTLTDRLSILPLAVCMGFGVLGLAQWTGRRSICRVDCDILLLGGTYLAVFAAYVLFEHLGVNSRPILIEGRLETSYPSSTTVLSLTVFGTAILQLRCRMQNGTGKRTMLTVIKMLMLFMVTARAVSGVHWLSDIVGGILLSGGFVSLYKYLSEKRGSSAVS